MYNNLGAQLVAVQAGMYANNVGDDGYENNILFHNNYWAGLVLAIIASAIYTLGGIYYKFDNDPELTCLVTALLLMFNFCQYVSCSDGVTNYHLKHKVRASVCSLVIALITFVPAVFFIFGDARVYKYAGWGKYEFVEYNTTMLVISVVLAVIGVLSVLLSAGNLCYIRHKCRVWGKRV